MEYECACGFTAKNFGRLSNHMSTKHKNYLLTQVLEFE